MKEINDNIFDNEVIGSDVPVVVDFWAPWCNPCKMIAPVMDELDKQYAGKIKFVKVNVDENTLNAQKLRISSIPNILVFKGGKVVDNVVGFRPKTDFEKMLNKYI